ncbi:hypothetical protein CYMTET_42857 [Cymbomonas tetramitiformis]|uniref:Uncharacterized protein n=1 Tax=Cymbomonas tetramitiformis TaxID=36881 RepID=A0AAE0C3F0_9CHLO|nr:hypothetical protein CYMTET_42857 [Cymbomonas tetramitiformis]
MRFPKLADTVRLMLMVANVVEQEALREKHPDIHEDEWCIKWLKTRGSVEVPEEEAKRVRRMAARHRWDEDKLKNDAEAWALTLQQELTRRKSGDKRKDFKKKEPSTPAGEDANKKPPREANNAERAKSSYNKVPPDFHKKRLNSRYENEMNNAKMREYNLKHMFTKHKMSITTEEWLKLPEAKQQRAAASAEVQDRLAAELSSMQTAGQAGGGKDAEAQALSDDEGDEAEYDSNFNEREGIRSR